MLQQVDAVDIGENMNIQQQTWRTEPAQQKTKWKERATRQKQDKTQIPKSLTAL